MLQADPLRNREVEFTYETKRYKAYFKKEKGWVIFNEIGVICPEHQMPELWHFFRVEKEPNETKALNFLNRL